MATNILMPALSPTMTEGTLARWLKKEGERVSPGDVVAEIETDKATMELEAVDEGVLGEILVPDGTAGVKVNQPIAVLVEEGEKPAAEPEPAKPTPKPEPRRAEPAAKAPPPERTATQTTAPQESAAVPPSQPDAHADGQDRIFASPLARRMAKQAGIDLSALKGSGPNGRIVKADIEAAQKGTAERPAAQRAEAPAPQRPPGGASPAAPIAAPHRLVPHSAMRRVIARRLTDAKREIPHFYVSVEVALDPLLMLRSELNARSAEQGPGAFKLSVNDMLIKAAAIALRRVPEVNASFTEEGIALYGNVDISVAVAIPDGLITPIIRDADQKGLAAISNEMKELIDKAKHGKLKPEEYQGGGFSISNMGMYGVSEFAAIINPPQAAILAVAAGQQRPVVKDGQIQVATLMTCTLSVDHRVVDGALGAEWLRAFKRIVEDPLSLML
ncbi:MAG: pyruvate dehydrogenase complex dihydrolipoamide acetyltransferase [Acetobacteraceae bacterium]|nr:pyruvate dehydrogenase complex dihydrolipoamide acetyltransferase [Acetobacteraceae bacterium]